MFQSFPLGDKSSVNLRGNFHVENVTTFEEFLKDSGANEDPMQLDGDEPVQTVTERTESGEQQLVPDSVNQEKDGRPVAMDFSTLYPVFWSLQNSFSNPPRLFEEDNFKEFQKSLEATLAKFRDVPKVLQSGDSERKKGQKLRAGDDHDAFANTFNPKYLTSRDLFKLEVCKYCRYFVSALTNSS